jgi:uncharacterized membrane protein YebE (DUF533 family)
MSADRILTRLLGSPEAKGFAGGLAASLLVSKAGRKLGKQALRMGGIAAIAGLGYAAWRSYQDERAPGAPRDVAPPTLAPAEPPPPFLPAATDTGAREDLGRALLQAMIAAARADGKLDGTERRALFENMARLELPETEPAELYAALERPVDIEALVGAASTQERAVEIYSASLLAIEVDTPAERGYLAMLAAGLGLPEALVARIHREAGVAEPAIAAEEAEGFRARAEAARADGLVRLEDA